MKAWGFVMERRRLWSDMARVTDEIIPYPGVFDDRLEVDPVFKDFQRDGRVRVQLPYGGRCWLATRYEHVRSVYGDRRFSRAAGFEHDVPVCGPGTPHRSVDAPGHGSAPGIPGCVA